MPLRLTLLLLALPADDDNIPDPIGCEEEKKDVPPLVEGSILDWEVAEVEASLNDRPVEALPSEDVFHGEWEAELFSSSFFFLDGFFGSVVVSRL